MGALRVYLKPFNDDGTYQSDWTEITDHVDVQGISELKQSLDNTEYDVGIFKNSGVTLKLINLTGKFSDVGQPGSIFKFRRSNTLVRITWSFMPYELICGFFDAGDVFLAEEKELFVGLLNDDALKQEAEDQNLQFKVLGKEAILSEITIPFADIESGDTFEELILAILDQEKVTNLLTVDPANISCTVNLAVDSVERLENRTGIEALREILFLSNSVMYILDDEIHVTSRDEGAEDAFTFYGQGSTAGMENIIDISEFRIGLNRTFNFWTWKDTSLVSQNLSSITNFGVRKKELDSEIITDDTKRQTILDALCLEFANPKREFTLRAPMEEETVDLRVLDKVVVDYPNVGINDSAPIPYWDLAVWDVAKYPNEVLPITIESTARFKLLSRNIDPTNQEMVLYLRET